jgi:hypothetical protein
MGYTFKFDSLLEAKMMIMLLLFPRSGVGTHFVPLKQYETKTDVSKRTSDMERWCIKDCIPTSDRVYG